MSLLLPKRFTGAPVTITHQLNNAISSLLSNSELHKKTYNSVKLSVVQMEVKFSV